MRLRVPTAHTALSAISRDEASLYNISTLAKRTSVCPSSLEEAHGDCHTEPPKCLLSFPPKGWRSGITPTPLPYYYPSPLPTLVRYEWWGLVVGRSRVLETCNNRGRKRSYVRTVQSLARNMGKLVLCLISENVDFEQIISTTECSRSSLEALECDQRRGRVNIPILKTTSDCSHYVLGIMKLPYVEIGGCRVEKDCFKVFNTMV